MNLQTIEIPRARAREEAAEYRRAAKTITDPARRREFEEIARAYRIAARDEVPMIALTPTIAAGGLIVRTHVIQAWREGGAVEVRTNYHLPALAVCRASAAYVHTLGVQPDGSIEFIDSLGRDGRYRKGVTQLDTHFEAADGLARGESLRNRWRGIGCWRAQVPIVPPKHRPAGTTDLAAFLVLWEADDWQWSTPPLPPGDPALLRHVGGDIYAVLATWDLTELEQLVLSGRRPDA